MVDNYTEAPSEEIKSLLLAMTAYEHECKAKPISKPSTLDGSTKINDVIITTVDTVFPEKQDKAEQEAKDKAEQEAKDKAERERLAKEKTEQEARDKTERERLAAEAKEAAELKAKEAKRIYDSRYFTIILKNIYLFFTLLGNMTHIQAGDLLRNGRSVELVMMLLRIVTYMMFSTLLFMLMSICMALPSFILPMLSFMMIVNCVWISMILVCISSIYTIVFSIYVWKMLTSHEHPLL